METPALLGKRHAEGSASTDCERWEPKRCRTSGADGTSAATAVADAGAHLALPLHRRHAPLKRACRPENLVDTYVLDTVKRRRTLGSGDDCKQDSGARSRNQPWVASATRLYLREKLSHGHASQSPKRKRGPESGDTKQKRARQEATCTRCALPSIRASPFRLVCSCRMMQQR